MKRTGILSATIAMTITISLCLAGCSSGGSSQETVAAEPVVQTKTVYVITERSTLLNDYEYSGHEFDKHGNLIKEIVTQPKNKNYSNTITFEYSEDGTPQKRVENVDYKALYDDYTLTITYDEHGEIASIESTIDGIQGYETDNEYELPPATFDNTYDSNGRLVERTYKNIRETYEYDADGKLITRTVYGGVGDQPTVLTYTYDENNNMIREDVKTDDSGWSNFYTYESMSVEVEG